MMGAQFEVPDAERTRLRTIVAAIDREMSLLSIQAAANGSTSTTDGLFASWAELVKLLALGPAPESRECPVCRHSGMRAATTCGYCWTKLSPLASVTKLSPLASVKGAQRAPAGA